MYRLSSQFCEFYNLTSEEQKNSPLWKELLAWLENTNQKQCFDMPAGEEINYNLVDEFDKYKQYLGN